jgi:hypothetical protein
MHLRYVAFLMPRWQMYKDDNFTDGTSILHVVVGIVPAWAAYGYNFIFMGNTYNTPFKLRVWAGIGSYPWITHTIPV